jgi:hypothetical protein
LSVYTEYANLKSRQVSAQAVTGKRTGTVQQVPVFAVNRVQAVRERLFRHPVKGKGKGKVPP